MAYFMLDLLFLLGDPKNSTTLLDDSCKDGQFIVGEAIPMHMKVIDKKKTNSYESSETRVRIDRTSQLLVSMAITVSELVKHRYLRGSKRKNDY